VGGWVRGRGIEGRKGRTTHLVHAVALDVLNCAQLDPHCGRSENWAWAPVMARRARVRRAVNVFIFAVVRVDRRV
jgi:hypothetical protein